MNPYQPSREAAESLSRRQWTWLQWIIRFCLVLVLTLPLAIGFQIVGMLLTGTGTHGFGWLVWGFLLMPTIIAWSMYLIELKNVRQMLINGTILGIVVSLTWILLGFALLVAAGPMDGGI